MLAGRCRRNCSHPALSRFTGEGRRQPVAPTGLLNPPFRLPIQFNTVIVLKKVCECLWASLVFNGGRKTDGWGACEPRSMTSITMDEGQVRITSASEMRAAVDAHVERAVREHARLAFRIAYAVLRNYHDAEDAVQETFLRVWRYSAKLGEIHDVKAWVSRIAWRVAIDRRKVRPEVAIPE